MEGLLQIQTSMMQPLLACTCKRHATLLALCAGWCAMWRRMRHARTGTSTSWRRPARAPALSAPTSQTEWRGCVLSRLICPHEAAEQDIFADDYANVTRQPTGPRGTLTFQKAEKRRIPCICVLVGGFEMLSPQGCDVMCRCRSPPSMILQMRSLWTLWSTSGASKQ